MQSDVLIKYEQEYRNLKLNLPEFVTDYTIKEELNKELRTRIAYLRDIKSFLAFLSNEVINKPTMDITLSDLNTIKENDIRNYIESLSEYTTTYKTKTDKEVNVKFTNDRSGKNRKLATLKSFFACLNEYKWINNNPAYTIKIKNAEKHSINTLLNRDEILALINTIENGLGIDKENSKELKAYNRLKDRDLAIVLLLSYTGIRVSELVQLNIDDVNTNLNTITVIRKGGFKDEVPYSDFIAEYVFRYVEKRKSINKKYEDIIVNKKNEAKDNKIKTKPNKLPNLNALFNSQQYTRITDKSVRNILAKYTERACLFKNVTCHTLRRTYLTSFYNATGDIRLTAKVAGHKSVDTTAKFYAAPSEERLKTEVYKFNY